jgi:hypothetical protein
MYSSNKPTKTHQTGSRKAECCTDVKCETGLRNNYFKGKRLTAESFRVEQDYAIQRRHLLNRAIHGWGVVYGYGIVQPPPQQGYNDLPPGSVEISPGLALDQCGRELFETGRALKFDELIVLDEHGKRVEGSDYPASECWLLSVHYAEQNTASIVIEDSCRCKYQEWDHICETVRYSVRPIKCDDCCRAWDCELKCNCGAGPCCDDQSGPGPSGQAYRTQGEQEEGKRQQRGGCRCICDHLIKWQPAGDCAHLYEIEEPCGAVKVDIRNGVPLACVKVDKDRNGYLIFGDILEVCGPRRLVKGNDLLFDLIRGCDLTRISDFGWKEWHRRKDPIPFDAFADAFGPGTSQATQSVSTRFKVRFSRPVREDTLRADCFAMTVLGGEAEGGWWHSFRVPIVEVDTSEFGPQPGDPPGHVRGAAIVVDDGWLDDAVRGRKTIFKLGETRIEIEVRGDLIVDCNGQTVDANSFGLFRVPTGNATAGGTFFSTFRVEQAPGSTRTNPAYRSNPAEGVSS